MGFQQEYQKDGVKKYRAEKLKTFRVTSTSEATVQAVAAVYGGQVTLWDTAPAGTGRQWQVVVESPFLDFLIIPDGFSSAFEKWTAGGCVHRCDGVIDDATGRACNPAEHEGAKPTSRLSGFLPLVPVVGSFRLESHGENAARELAAFADLMAAAEMGGFRTPIRLRIEERSSQQAGQPRHDYIVPVPEIVGLTPQQLLGAGPVEAEYRALPSGVPSLPRGDRLVRDAYDDALEGISEEAEPVTYALATGMTLEEIQSIAKEQNVSVSMLNAQAKLLEPTGRTLPNVSPQERLELAQRLLGV
jgi:hypothetical protein